MIELSFAFLKVYSNNAYLSKHSSLHTQEDKLETYGTQNKNTFQFREIWGQRPEWKIVDTPSEITLATLLYLPRLALLKIILSIKEFILNQMLTLSYNIEENLQRMKLQQ